MKIAISDPMQTDFDTFIQKLTMHMNSLWASSE